MLKSTQGHIETRKFDAYKARIAKLSDAQKKPTSAHIDAILSGMDEPKSFSVDTKNTFGLTPAEIENIGNDIEAKLPILGSNLAIIKLFTALGFTDVSKKEKNGKLTLWMNEYEVFKTKAQKGPHKGQEISVIRMPNYNLEGENTDMANKAMAAIRSLLSGKSINFTLEALNAMADTHGIYPGYRRMGSGKSNYVDVSVYSHSQYPGGGLLDAPYTWRNRNGDSSSSLDDRQHALCLVASCG